MILDGRWFVSIQCHYRTCMASYNESHSFYVPSNGKLPHRNESHSRSDRTPTRRFGLRCLTLIFFRPPCWGLPLVEVIYPLSIKLSESRSYGNLHESQLSEPITRPICRSTLHQQYMNKPRRTIVQAYTDLATKTYKTSFFTDDKEKIVHITPSQQQRKKWVDDINTMMTQKQVGRLKSPNSRH